MQTDTICAPATATGGALCIIRVSGPRAFPIVSSLCDVCCDKVPANTVHYTHIKAPLHLEGQAETIIDEVMVCIFHAPRSYTGEDTVEISCHGSSYIQKSILELLILNGCRMAQPGEYTMRAFLNGKMDLSQAEAVADLIASTNKATHDIALSQLRGHFSSDLARLRKQLLELTSLLELELDFSDHEDLEFADRSQLLALAQEIEFHIAQLTSSFKTGQAIKQGVPVAIVGKTNVGKSTLLNRLLHEERAIVSDIHGTTRDTIEDTIDINGITFRFIDTAGLRKTEDQIEKIGIDRTYQAIDRARIILWIIDAPPSTEEQKEMEARCKEKKLIIVSNKSDKGIVIADSEFSIHYSTLISISAKTGQCQEALESAIYSAANLPSITANDVIVTNARHFEALQNAHTSISRVITVLTQQLPVDLIAEDLRQVITDLTEITGDGLITPQETLNNIFQNFCVGK